MIYKSEGAASFDVFDQEDVESAEVGLLRSSLSTFGEGMVGGMSLRSKRAAVCGEPAASSCPSTLSLSSLLSTSPSKPTATNGALVSNRSMAAPVLKKHGPYADKGHLMTWIDAMRAQSPPRFRTHHGEIPEGLGMEAVAYSAWLEKHPSALSSFERVAKLAKSKQIVVFLDYDGTLSPIVANPDRAVMSDEVSVYGEKVYDREEHEFVTRGTCICRLADQRIIKRIVTYFVFLTAYSVSAAPQMRATVKEVATCFPTAIISGRARPKVYEFVQLSELYYAGSHGMDIMGPANSSSGFKVNGTRGQDKGNDVVFFQPASEYLPLMDTVCIILTESTTVIKGARVEHNKYCVTVHFRNVKEELWEALASKVQNILKDYPSLSLTHGRKVLEVRPAIAWDKGKAVDYLLNSLGFADSSDVLPVYIGDDRTDEDAFKLLNGMQHGCSILVSSAPKSTKATFSLRDPSEVQEFLRRLVHWKKWGSEKRNSFRNGRHFIN